MNALPIPMLCAIDNRGVPGVDHCFGAPFIAKNFDTAKEMVKKAIGDKKDLVNLKEFYLVELARYDITCSIPVCIPNDIDFLELPVCVADLFEEEENPADEVAYCGRYHGVSSEQIGEESELADEQE